MQVMSNGSNPGNASNRGLPASYGAIRVRVENSSVQLWTELTMSLVDDGDEQPPLVHSPHFKAALYGVDDLAKSYSLEDWEKAVLRGAASAFRALSRTPISLFLFRIEGRLHSENLEELAFAAEVGVACLLGAEVSSQCLEGWSCTHVTITAGGGPVPT